MIRVCATLAVGAASLLAACAPKPPATNAAWERATLAPGPVRLEHHHQVGERYRERYLQRGTMTLQPSAGEPTPLTFDLAIDADRTDEITQAPPGGPFGEVLRGGRLVLDLLAHAKGERKGSDHKEQVVSPDGRVTFIQRDNAWPEEKPVVPPRDRSTYSFGMVPQLRPLTNDPWPAHPLRAGDTWTRAGDLVEYHQGDGTPTRQRRWTRWRFLGVDAGGYAHLRCDGRWRVDGDERTTAGRAVMRGGGAFAGAARLDLKNGYAGAWRFVSTGRVKVTITSTKEKKKVMHLESDARWDITNEQLAAPGAAPPAR